MKVRLHLLGVPHAELDGHRVEIPPSRPAMLLMHLAYHGEWLGREQLAWVFRPRDDEQRARYNVRLLLTRARRLPWAAGLEVERSRLRWQVGNDVADLRAALEAGDWDRADGLHQGELLSGWDAEGPLGSWLLQERQALQAAWREAAMQRAHAHQGQGEHGQALVLLRRVLELDPLAEDVLQRFLASCVAGGAREEGRQRYQDFRTRLAAELGLEPLEATSSLAEAVALGRGGRPEGRRPGPPRRPGGAERWTRPDLVGRAEALSAAAEAAADAVLLVKGEAGVGKTRLLEELLAGSDALWIRGRQGLQDVPWLPVATTLRGRLEHLRRRVLRAPLAPYRAELASLLPEVLEADAPTVAEAGTAARVLEALAVALTDAIAAGDGQGPALVFDDVQWLDGDSLRLLVYLAERPGLRIYATLRQGDEPPAWQEAARALRSSGRLQTLPLAPLSEQGTDALLTAVAGAQPPAELLRRLQQATGGSPLMLLQTLVDWRDRGLIGGAAAGWPALDPADPILPAAELVELLRGRLAALDAESRRVLDAAAVLGHDLPPAALAAMAALSEAAAAAAMGRAEAAGVVRDGAFVHDFFRQVLWQDLPASVRRHLHARAAAGLAEAGADELLVAEHLAKAGDLEQAADIWFSAASTRFARQPGFEQASEELYRRILDAGLRTPAYHRACAYLAGRRMAQDRRGEADVLVALVLEESEDDLARTFAHIQMAIMQYADGDLREAERHADLAHQQARGLKVEAIHRDLQLLRSTVLHARQRYGDSLAISSAMVAELRLGPPSFALGTWLGRLAGDLCALGRYEDALPLMHEHLAVARRMRHPRQQVAAINDILATLHDLGRVGEGLELGLEGRAIGDFDVTWPLLLHLALAKRARGDTAGALADLRELLDGRPTTNTRAHGLALLAEMLHETAQPAARDAAIEDGLALVQGTDVQDARAVVAIAASRFGAPPLARRGRALLAGMDVAALPAYLRGDAEAVLGIVPLRPMVAAGN